MKFFIRTHKWLGIAVCLFVIVFSLSGIFLNHRQVIAKCDVPRTILPANYQYQNWNNASIKGSVRLSADSILLYGSSGIWLTDSIRSSFDDYMAGMTTGADNRNTVNIVRTKSDEIFALTIFDLYQLDKNTNRWENKTKELGTDERLADATIKGDSLVVITRSHTYLSTDPYSHFEQIELLKPTNYENKLSAFRAMWTLHSGEMFGLLGKLVVDFVGVVLIILSLSGIIIFIFPKWIKRIKTAEKRKRLSAFLKGNYKWHNKLGAWFLVLSIVIILSGIFLRPPAMIFIIRDKISPIPSSVYDTPNPWFDKLRTIRYDAHAKEWLLYTSDGFYQMTGLNHTPLPIKGVPKVSVMGVTVLEEMAPALWVVGSFNGLCYWDRSGERYIDVSQMRPLYKNEQKIVGGFVEEQRGVIGGIDVSGYSNDFSDGEFVFSYSEGALSIGKSTSFGRMPEAIEKGKISLWHLSLEAHVGRIYTPIVGSLIGESIFVLVSGIVILFIYISGYIVYRKKWKKNSFQKQK